MTAAFITRFGAHRARILRDSGVAMPSPVRRSDAPTPGEVVRVGRTRPVSTTKGISGAMMRRTVSDVFAAGDELGIPGPLLARHMPGIAELTQQLSKTAKAIERAGLLDLPARVLGTMTPALLELDPASSSRAIADVLGTLESLAKGPGLNAHQARAIERVAFVVGQLDTQEPGGAFDDAVEVLGNNDDEIVLRAATQTLADSMGTIVASGGATRELFLAALKAALAGRASEELEAGLTAGQIEILRAQASIAGQHRDRLARENEQARRETEQLIARLGSKLEPIEEMQARIDQLSAGSKKQLYQQLASHAAGAPPETFKAIAAAQLSFLGRSAPPDGAADQISKLFLQLAAAGAPADALLAIAEKHVGKPEPQEVVTTLTVLHQVVSRLGGNLPNAEGMVALADSLIGTTKRYTDGDPKPLESLVAALVRGAGDEAVLAHATKHASRYSAAIPKVEGGPIVEQLRASFAEDLAAVASAKLDVAVLDSTWPRVPSDSIARLAAIGLKHGVDLDEWFADLDKYFAAGRRNKDHERNLRTLLVAIDHGGGNPIELVKAVLEAKLRMADLCKLARYMCIETNFTVPPEYVREAVLQLQAHANLVSDIEGRMHTAVMEKLNLGGLLQGAENVRVTEKGLAAVQGPVATLFSSAAGRNNVPQDLLKGLLKATLADRVDQYKFETPAAEAQLACLTDEARAKWMERQTMMHIRFEGDGEQVFQERVRRTALIGGAILEILTESWGSLEDLSKERDTLVDQIRAAHKEGDKEKRKEIGRKLEGLPQRIEALEWATTLAGLAPENVTPERFEELAQPISRFRRVFGPSLEEATEELLWTIRLTGISYTQVVTDDGPDLPTMYAMTVDRNKTGGGCLNWPGNRGEAMAYWIDPNKRMIITRNTAGQERRVVMRLVERQDAGHEGEPMLILEKAYPAFEANHEEKRRLIEHLLRRAADMGIACGFATEYYWDASKTSRFRSRAQYADMNDILIDLSKRYGTEIEKQEMKVLTRRGNTAEEYLDSDPPPNQRGVATLRRWTHNFQQDSKVFENEFIVMVPK